MAYIERKTKMKASRNDIWDALREHKTILIDDFVPNMKQPDAWMTMLRSCSVIDYERIGSVRSRHGYSWVVRLLMDIGPLPPIIRNHRGGIAKYLVDQNFRFKVLAKHGVGAFEVGDFWNYEQYAKKPQELESPDRWSPFDGWAAVPGSKDRKTSKSIRTRYVKGVW